MSFFLRQSMGYVWWIPLRFIPPTKKAMATEKKSYGFLKMWTSQKKNLGLWTAKTSTSKPSALNLNNPGFSVEPQNLKPGSHENWILDSGTLKAGSAKTLDPEFAQTCPNFWLCHIWIICIQSIIWWSFIIIIWLLCDHHRIIIWSQRLDVIKREEMNLRLLPIDIYF